MKTPFLLFLFYTFLFHFVLRVGFIIQSFFYGNIDIYTGTVVIYLSLL